MERNINNLKPLVYLGDLGNRASYIFSITEDDSVGIVIDLDGNNFTNPHSVLGISKFMPWEIIPEGQYQLAREDVVQNLSIDKQTELNQLLSIPTSLGELKKAFKEMEETSFLKDVALAYDVPEMVPPIYQYFEKAETEKASFPLFQSYLDSLKTILKKTKKTIYADAIIKDHEGKILLLKRSWDESFEPKKWCLPGGHVDFGENPFDAVIREVKEETNLDVRVYRLYDTYEDDRSIIYYFECFLIEPGVITLKSDEHQQATFFSKEDLLKEDLLMDLKERINKWFEREYLQTVQLNKAVPGMKLVSLVDKNGHIVRRWTVSDKASGKVLGLGERNAFIMNNEPLSGEQVLNRYKDMVAYAVVRDMNDPSQPVKTYLPGKNVYTLKKQITSAPVKPKIEHIGFKEEYLRIEPYTDDSERIEREEKEKEIYAQWEKEIQLDIENQRQQEALEQLNND